jgi:hypothetical protein
MDGWMDGWMDEWMEVKAILRIAYSNQQMLLVSVKVLVMKLERQQNLIMSLGFELATKNCKVMKC